MAIKDFGSQVKTAWKNLRPMTKEMLAGFINRSKKSRKKNYSYDAHADWEIISLLDALDQQVVKKVDTAKDKLEEIAHLAEICASVLEAKTESAEIFIKLAERALKRNNFAKIDSLSDALLERFPPSEISEVIRQTDVPQIKAISFETLAIMPTSTIVPLLKDPLYFEIACNVLEQQAIEFQNMEARVVLEQMDADSYLNRGGF